MNEDSAPAAAGMPPAWIPVIPPGSVPHFWDRNDPRPRVRVSDSAPLAARSLIRFGAIPIDYNPLPGLAPLNESV